VNGAAPPRGEVQASRRPASTPDRRRAERPPAEHSQHPHQSTGGAASAVVVRMTVVSADPRLARDTSFSSGSGNG
jgi:hypothetical protein